MKKTRRVIINGLSLKEYALKKPIAITDKGSFIMVQDIVARPGRALRSLRNLDLRLQVKLAIERNRLEPTYKLGIINKKVMTKNQIIDQMKKRTAIGEKIVKAEMDYCDELMSVLITHRTYKWPKKPKTRPATIPKQWQWIPKRWWRKWRQYFRNIALFCENTTDELTRHAAKYRLKHIHNAFKSSGFMVISLEGSDDIRARFSSIARNNRVVYIAGVGHGSPSKYTGHLGDTILKVCSYNPDEVKGKVIQLLSCQTAQRLGPDMVRKGASAYAGYDEDYSFIFDQPGTAIDEMALFWKCDGMWDLMMACGHTAEKAHQATINAYDAAIASMPNTVAATWLMHDKKCFRSPSTGRRYGSKNAKIKPYIVSPKSPFAEVEQQIQRYDTRRK